MSVAEYYAQHACEGRAWLRKNQHQGHRWIVCARAINGAVSYWLCGSETVEIIELSPLHPIPVLAYEDRAA